MAPYLLPIVLLTISMSSVAGHFISASDVPGLLVGVASFAVFNIVDRSMQVLGGLGITDDTIVARIFREVRPFRIYDGPSEVHRWSIAQRVLRQRGSGS